MKVSAPQFMSTSAPPADAPVPTPDAPTDPAAPPPPVEPPKQAVWPHWFVGVDKALIVFALLFAFLMASFAARNSDIYRHLAAGKRLLNGTYSLGSDPFSYTGADAKRPWVNQEWLFDLTVYAAFSADPSGALAVVLKAVVYAAAFGVLLWFRRAGSAGWPWAVMIAAGALAAATGANLRPVVFGMLFLSLLMLLLYRGDWATRRGRTLALVGGLCWLWGGFDSYAILGPVLVLVVALGGLVQKAFTAPPVPTDPLPDAEASPAPRTLLLAAAVALLGVLLNPTFLIGLTKDPGAAVAQLVPFELSFGTRAALAEDVDFRPYTYSLLSNAYWASPAFGLNFGSAGLFLLVLVGAIGLALGVARTPPGLIALWFATLVLCFFSYRFVPLFAVAAVPLVAGLLNGVSARLRLGTTADGGTNGLLLASRLGRIVTVPLLLVMLAATVPGWLHIHSRGLFQRSELDRRLEWRIPPDESLTRGLEQLQRWRATGDLAAGDRGLLVDPEFGDYAAWFAPAEPVFANTRFRFHTDELGDLIQVRDALLSRRQRREKDAPPPPSAVPVADKYDAAYVVFGRMNTPTDLRAVIPAILRLSAERPNLRALWHLDGRTAIVGRSNTARARALGDLLHLDVPRLAFAPQIPLPDGPTAAPPNPTLDLGWLAPFLDRPPAAPATLDDVDAFANLSSWVGQVEDERTTPERLVALGAATGGWPLDTARPIPIPARGPSEAELAIPLLLNRTARRAVAEAPNDALPYFALDLAHRTPPMPEVEAGDTPRERLTALARYAARTPAATCPPAELPRAVVAWMELFTLQLELRQWDQARESVKKARETVAAVTAAHPDAAPLELARPVAVALSRLAPLFRQVTGEDLPLGGGEFDFDAQARKGGRAEPPSLTGLLKRLDDAITTVVSRVNEEWDRATRGRKPAELVAAARQIGLPGKAAESLKTLLNRKPAVTPAEAGVRSIAELALTLIDLELQLGRLEEAHEDLAELEKRPEVVPDYLQPVLTQLKAVKLRRQGSYTAARALLEEQYGGNRLTPLTPDERRSAAQRPVARAIPLAAAAGSLAIQLPTFQPPKDIAPDAARALAAAFQQRYLNTHPLVVGHVARLKLLAEARYYYQRGVLALLAGEMPVAAESFRQVFAPQGVPLPVVLQAQSESGRVLNQPIDLDMYMPAHPYLGQYLRLIERYKNEPPRP